MLVDLLVAQLLCARLCHDLVGPAGAVNAGLELMQEAPAGEALELAARSGRQVVRRIAFYRAAFGLGGSAEGADLAEARALAAGFLADGRVTLDWSVEAASAERRLAPAGARLILNLVLLGVDSLPRGGTVGVHVVDLEEGLGVAILASGKGARMRSYVHAAMRPDASAAELSARSVQGYLTRLLAEGLGSAVEVSADAADQVRLALVLERA